MTRHLFPIANNGGWRLGYLWRSGRQNVGLQQKQPLVEPTLLLRHARRTNDFSLGIGPLPEEEIFVPTYVNFIRKILSLHPSAKVVITEGAIVNDEAVPRDHRKPYCEST